MALDLQENSGQQQALEFCKHMLQSLRLTRLYDTDNVNFTEPLTKLRDVIIRVSDRMGSARVQSEEGMLYFNKDPVRGGRRAFGTIQGLVKALDQIGIAEIAFTGAVSVDALRAFFGLLKLPEGVRELDVDAVKEGLKNAKLAELIQVYRPGETTGAAQIQQIEIDEKTYFPLAYARTLVLLREYVKNLRQEELNRYFTQKLHRAIQELVRLVNKYPHKFLAMAGVRDVDDFLFNHMANVGMLSIVLGHNLGISRVNLSDLGLAAMLHGLGKFRTDKRLWNRTKMPPQAMKELGRHPYRLLGAVAEGRKITRKTLVASTAGFEWDLVRKQTNLRKPLPEEHPYAKIIRVCEAYDLLTSNLADRPAMSPDQAIKKMVSAPKGWFDEVILTVFTNMMGLFPTGTTVTLSTGEIAVVVHPNPQKPKRPLVAIVMDRNGLQGDGDFLDLAEKIDGRYPAEITGSVDPTELGINVPDYLLA
ncbi:MAG: hypothetical protein D6731_03550 [Planctomycetota bacterium]|nr:MAG: hypothetical protein D6731_03550 [Planctomycetota bacterium]